MSYKFVVVRPTRIGGDLPGTDYLISRAKQPGKLVNYVLRRKLIKALSGYSENLKMHENARLVHRFRCINKSLRCAESFE